MDKEDPFVIHVSRTSLKAGYHRISTNAEVAEAPFSPVIDSKYLPEGKPSDETATIPR